MYGFNKEQIKADRTKVVCTLGPSSDSYEQIRELAEAGMDVARLNFSHGTREQHGRFQRLVRSVSQDLDRPIGILQDLQGPKIRLGKLQGGWVRLEPGEDFILASGKEEGNVIRASVSYPDLAGEVQPGQRVLIDDGNIELVVEEIEGHEVRCRVVRGGLLHERKGVNLPETRLGLRLPTAKDLEDLAFGTKVLGVDLIGLSFVQSASDIRLARTEVERLQCRTALVAKIERPQAVADIDAITNETDAVMIARGDLGVEMPPEEVPAIQKEIIALCNRKGVAVITATQMLESMIQSPRPTRAEASDVANAVIDGSDAVMLSAETAIGSYPVEAVRIIRRIIRITEGRFERRPAACRVPDTGQSADLAIGQSACAAAEVVGASAIVCLTQSGSTAARISQFRPTRPILAFTANRQALGRMTLLWGVTPFLLEEPFESIEALVAHLLEQFKRDGFASGGQKLVFTAGLPFAKKRSTNMIRIEEV
jgi:pyruvate kinase